MYMQVQIHDEAEGIEGIVDAFEHFDEDHVLGYVHTDGSAVDMENFVKPRIVYVSREVLEALPV